MSADVLARSALAVGAVLGSTGVSIALIESLRKRSLRTSSLAQRWRTWAVLAVLWLVAIAWPPVLFGILAILGAVMAYEFCKLNRIFGLDRIVLAPSPFLALCALALGAPLGLVLAQLMLSMTLLPLFSEDVERGPQRIGRNVAAVAVVVLPLMSIWIIGSSSEAILLALLIGVALSDVAAFTVGSLAGRRPLAAEISPHKTWEGAGGNLVGAAVGVSIATVAAGISIGTALILVPIIAIGAIWGDLLESLFKRHADVKDAGRLLPGFGGVLDRVDSLIVAAPLTLMILELVPQLP